MLANQLKRLEDFGYISKEIVSKTPLIAEYRLTEMGLGTNKIIYERLKFGMKFGLPDLNKPEFKTFNLEKIFGIE